MPCKRWLIWLVVGWLGDGLRAAPPITTRERLAEALIQQTQRDPEFARFPRLREHVISIIRRRTQHERPLAVHPTMAELLGGNGCPSLEMTQQDVDDFFRACAADRATILRAIGFVARVVHQTGITVYMDGRLVRNALVRQNLDIGLAMPVDHLVLFAYVPDAWIEPDYQCRFIAAYGQSYEHRFPKEVLDATLRLGTGRSAVMVNPWKTPPVSETVYVVEGRIIYGERGIGLVGIRGVGGRKHGVLGTVQRVLFFLPDAIDAMVIRDGDLHVKAIVSQRVRGFEQLPRYAVHRKTRFSP